jgi:hypothetical protein
LADIHYLFLYRENNLLLKSWGKNRIKIKLNKVIKTGPTTYNLSLIKFKIYFLAKKSNKLYFVEVKSVSRLPAKALATEGRTLAQNVPRETHATDRNNPKSVTHGTFDNDNYYY